MYFSGKVTMHTYVARIVLPYWCLSQTKQTLHYSDDWTYLLFCARVPLLFGVWYFVLYLFCSLDSIILCFLLSWLRTVSFFVVFSFVSQFFVSFAILHLVVYLYTEDQSINCKWTEHHSWGIISSDQKLLSLCFCR